MVIHEEDEGPMEETSLITRPAIMESKKYLIVKNHVREMSLDDNKSILTSESEETQANSKATKRKKTSKKNSTQSDDAESTTSLESSDEVNTSSTEISQSDLQELRNVYTQCKEIIHKIETKYANLLNLDNKPSTSKIKFTSKESQEDCQCALNKRIVFDEEGKASEINSHACSKKKKIQQSLQPVEKENVNIEYEKQNIELPDDLLSLTTLLKSSDLDLTYRDKVIEKVKSLKQEHINNIKFNRYFLIEKTKKNANEVFEFNGSNLCTLPGYPS